MFVKKILTIMLLAFIALLAAPAVDAGTVRGVADTFEHQGYASSQTKLHHHRVLEEESTTGALQKIHFVFYYRNLELLEEPNSLIHSINPFFAVLILTNFSEPALEDEVAVEPRIISEIVSVFAAILTLPLSIIQAVLGVF